MKLKIEKVIEQSMMEIKFQKFCKIMTLAQKYNFIGCQNNDVNRD